MRRRSCCGVTASEMRPVRVAAKYSSSLNVLLLGGQQADVGERQAVRQVVYELAQPRLDVPRPSLQQPRALVIRRARPAVGVARTDPPGGHNGRGHHGRRGRAPAKAPRRARRAASRRRAARGRLSTPRAQRDRARDQECALGSRCSAASGSRCSHRPRRPRTRSPSTARRSTTTAIWRSATGRAGTRPATTNCCSPSTVCSSRCGGAPSAASRRTTPRTATQSRPDLSHPTRSLDPERQRRDVEEEEVLGGVGGSAGEPPVHTHGTGVRFRRISA